MTAAFSTTGGYPNPQAGGYQPSPSTADFATQAIASTLPGSKFDTITRLQSAFSRAQVSNPEISGLYSPAPTVTSNNTTDAGLTKNYAPNATFTTKVWVTGGRFYYGSNSRGYVATQNIAADAGNLTGITSPTPTPPTGENCIGPYYYKFCTDAPKFQIQGAAFVASKNNRMIVDGKYIDLTGWDMVANNYLTIDFGSRSPGRTVEFECQGNVALFQIKVDTLSRVWRPTPKDVIRASITGDSHTEGSAGMTNTPGLGCSAILSRLLGIWDMRISSTAGTGYVHMGTSTVRKAIPAQIPDWVNDGKYDLIIPAGGYNDTGEVQSAVLQAAVTSWQMIRAAQPRAFIPIFGIWGAALGPSASQITLETALQSTFNAWADPFSVFIPVSTAVEPWEFGTGFAGATNGTGNSDNYVSSDGVHDLALGQAYRAQRMADSIRDAVFAYGRA